LSAIQLKPTSKHYIKTQLMYIIDQTTNVSLKSC